MDSLEQIDAVYCTPDPWGYKTNPCDIERKKLILKYAAATPPYKRALDLGAGEGWITQDLPAEEIFGYELSDRAASRFPPNVKRIKRPEGNYDLMIATGVLYPHYDYSKLIHVILEHASGTVILCHLKHVEHPKVKTIPNQILVREFPYRGVTQILRIYNFFK